MVAVAVFLTDLDILARYRYTWFVAGILLLATTLIFGVNPTGFGAALWLKVPIIPNVYFQPSELLKLLLLIFLASYFAGRDHLLQVRQSRFGFLDTFPYLAPLLLMWGFSMLLLILQEDLGAATLFFVVFLALLYLATGEWIYVAGGGVLLGIAGIFAYTQFALVQLRLETWLNPFPEAQDRAYQIVQSLYALASGNIMGTGIYQGFPEYIPVVHSDFVFAAVGEEWGLIGTWGLVACFALLAYRGMRIAMLAENSFPFYLSAGISLIFTTQALLIMGGVTKVLPLTGVTLPFVSYGGSSLLISCVMAGLLLMMSGAEHQAV
jgi:cell division protein FtsW (lipid II flippase)